MITFQTMENFDKFQLNLMEQKFIILILASSKFSVSLMWYTNMVTLFYHSIQIDEIEQKYTFQAGVQTC